VLQIKNKQMEQNTNETKAPQAQPAAAAPKKRSKGFLIVLILLVLGGGWFAYSKYTHAQHHEETDDAQIEANISPVIPRVPGYVKAVLVKDNQVVKKGDTLLILDDRDLVLKVQQAEAALATSQSNLGAAQATTNASKATIAAQMQALVLLMHK